MRSGPVREGWWRARAGLVLAAAVVDPLVADASQTATSGLGRLYCDAGPVAGVWVLVAAAWAVGGWLLLVRAVRAVYEPVDRLELEVLTSGEDMAERSRCTLLPRDVDGGTCLDINVEGLSDSDTAAGMQTGWTCCLEGIAAVLDEPVRAL